MRRGMTRTTTSQRRASTSGRRDAFEGAYGREDDVGTYDDDDDDDDSDSDGELMDYDDEVDRVSFLASTTFRSSAASSDRRARAARRRDGDSERCGCASGAVAACLLVLGVSSIGRASYSNVLARQREAYARVVEAWDDGEREKFARAKFEWALVADGEQPTWLSTRAVTTRAKEGVNFGAATYEPLRYALEGGDLLEAFGIPSLIRDGVLDARDAPDIHDILHPDADIHSYTSGYNNTAVMNALMGTRALRLRVNDGVQALDVRNVELFTKEFLPITNWKTCKYQHAGYPNHGGCDTYSVIDRICVKLQTSGGEWLLDTSGGGAGCEARAASEDGSRADAYDPIIRHRIVAPVTGAYPALSVVRKTLALTRDAETAVLLRASNDPHVWLLNATDGTAAFAAAQSRLNAAGIAFVVLAAVFSIPAICLLLPILYDKSTAKGRYGRRSRRVEPVQLRDMV